MEWSDEDKWLSPINPKDLAEPVLFYMEVVLSGRGNFSSKNSENVGTNYVKKKIEKVNSAVSR